MLQVACSPFRSRYPRACPKDVLGHISHIATENQIRRTLNCLEQWWDVLRNGGKGIVQRLAQFAIEHQIQLVVQQLRQVRSHCRRQHADTLEHGLFRWRILFPARSVNPGSSSGQVLLNLPMHLQSLFDVGHDSVQEGLHLAPDSDSYMANSDERYSNGIMDTIFMT